MHGDLLRSARELDLEFLVPVTPANLAVPCGEQSTQPVGDAESLLQ